MSKSKRQSDHAMLESWRPPRGAGDPVGCLTTTFTFDAGFFEEECLARFLEIDSLPDREGLAYLLERENRLGPTYAGVLVDYRQAGVDHSLRWDVLPVRIQRGKQHAKLSLLVWTNHARIIVASANLTQHGYRYNHEVAGAIELTPTEASHTLLEEACSFLNALIGFVPSAGDDPACTRARQFIEQVRRQVEGWSDVVRRGRRLLQHLTFTLPRRGEDQPARSSLSDCLSACRKYGGAPSDVSTASPFFDPAPPRDHDEVTVELCKGMARGAKRSLTLCVPTVGDVSEGIRLAAPKSLLNTAVRRVDRLNVDILPRVDGDKNTRPWHAKMLALSSSKYNALMVGSSNFTKAGMGVGPVRNAEANLIYVARREAFSRESGFLDECWPGTTPVDAPDDAEWQGPQAELVEEEQSALLPAIPSGFLSVQYRAGDQPRLLLKFAADKLPNDWLILAGIKHDQNILDSTTYHAGQSPADMAVPWSLEYAPGKLLVRWGDQQAFWSVNVEDQSKLPVPREIEAMTAQDLLYILAASDASAAFRVWARQRQTESDFDEELDSAVPPDLDPLRRYNLQDTFLRRVRRQARLLAAVKHNLERPVWSEQALQWRLTGMIGVERLASRVAKGLDESNVNASEIVLNLADLLLMLGEIKYRESETALSCRKFARLYKQFIRRLSAELNTKVQAAHGVPQDVRNFWARIHRRCVQ
jgi:hypothetical protein